MKRKHIFLALCSIFFCLLLSPSANAQVVVGMGARAEAGALLQLKENNEIGVNAVRGLMLPRVRLVETTSVEIYTNDTEGPTQNMFAASGLYDGMTVYNLTDNADVKGAIGVCPGVYMWNTMKWTRLHDPCDLPPITCNVNIVSVVTNKPTNCGTATGVTLTAVTNPANSSIECVWYASSGGTVLGRTASGGAYSVGTVNTTTTYYVKAYDKTNDCYSDEKSVTVTINDLPPTPTATNPAKICSGSTATLTVDDYNSNYRYFWYTDNTSGTGVESTLANAAFTTAALTNTTAAESSKDYYVQAVDKITKCVSTFTKVTVTVRPVLTAAITVPSTVCQGADVTLTWNGTTGVAGTTIRWYDKNETEIATASGNASLLIDKGDLSANQTYTYYASISYDDDPNCAPSNKATASFTVTGEVTPSISEINVCEKEEYTLPATEGANNLKWFNQANTELTGNNLKVTTTTPGTQIFYAEFASTGSTCPSGRATVTVTVNPLPTLTNDNHEVCSATEFDYTPPTTGNLASVTWTRETLTNVTATGIATGATTALTGQTLTLANATLPGNAGYNYTLITDKGCSLTGTITIIVNPLPDKPVADAQEICTGTMAVLTVNGANTTKYSYQWYDATGAAISGATNEEYTTAPLTANTWYTVKATDRATGCYMTSDKINVRVIPAESPIPTFADDNPLIILGTQVTLTPTNIPEGNYEVKWYEENGTTFLATGNSFTTPALDASTTYKVCYVHKTLNCGTSPMATIKVDVAGFRFTQDNCKRDGVWTVFVDGVDSYTFKLFDTNNDELTDGTYQYDPKVENKTGSIDNVSVSGKTITKIAAHFPITFKVEVTDNNNTSRKVLAPYTSPSFDARTYSETKGTKDANGNEVGGTFTIGADNRTHYYAEFGKAGTWMTNNLGTSYLPNGQMITIASTSVTDGEMTDTAYYALPSNKAFTQADGLLYSLGATLAKNPGDEYHDQHFIKERTKYPSKSALCSGYVDQSRVADGTPGSDEVETKQRMVQGICPAGWHIPSDREWSLLEEELENHTSKYTNTPVSDGSWDPAWATKYSNLGNSTALYPRGTEAWKAVMRKMEGIENIWVSSPTGTFIEPYTGDNSDSKPAELGGFDGKWTGILQRGKVIMYTNDPLNTEGKNLGAVVYYWASSEKVHYDVVSGLYTYRHHVRAANSALLYDIGTFGRHQLYLSKSLGGTVRCKKNEY
ncbi:MAG: FISUMP domain-containing protein [Dysgonomonas sp.]|nr:FISUMP domain-containing protein [Dysgonomonas sp.]